jgi:hypothetical protein
VRIGGPLQPDALDQALAALQRRHEALRTAFTVDERGVCAPVILDARSCAIRMDTIDLPELGADTRGDAQYRVLQADNDGPFALDRAPLCRASLARLAADDHLLVLTMPYLLCDGASVNILLEDLAALYTAVVTGADVALPEPTFRYVDFAHWQRQWIAGPAAAAQFAYWRERLAPPLPALWPQAGAADDCDTPCFSVRSVLPFTIGAAGTAAARRIARRERTTLFATVLAALELVLHARSGAADIRIGALAGNRGLAGADRVVGLFANAVCIRTRIDRSSTFGALVRRAHAAVGDAAARQEVPFEIVARACDAAYGLPGCALFQVMVFWGMAPPALRFASLDAKAARLDDRESMVLTRNQLDLRIVFHDDPQDLAGSVTYRASLFGAEQIRGLIDDLVRCLRVADADDGVAVDRLCAILSETAPSAPAT